MPFHQGEHTRRVRRAYKECIQGVHTRSAYKECIQGVHTRSACKEGTQGGYSRRALTELFLQGEQVRRVLRRLYKEGKQGGHSKRARKENIQSMIFHCNCVVSRYCSLTAYPEGPQELRGGPASQGGSASKEST